MIRLAVVSLNYHRKLPERQPRLTRAEFIVILTGAAILTAILVGAVWFYVYALHVP